MDADIHSVDTEKRNSEGNNLYVRGASMDLVVKEYGDLPFGGYRDQHYLELRASSWEGATESTLTAKLNAEELQRLFDFALEHDLVDGRVSRRALELLRQLHEELAVANRQPPEAKQ
jgi:hypothetical protein